MRRAVAPSLAVVLGYVLAALAFSWPLPLHLATHLTGDPGGDTGVYVWNQWVFHEELVSGHNPLRTDKILAMSSPSVDLTQHNYTAFLNTLALPLISSLGVIASFNVVFLVVCVLNAVMMYGLARRVTAANRWEAWLAGLAFGWSPAMIARTTGHFSLAAAAALPAFLWCLVNAERSRSTRDAALVGVCMLTSAGLALAAASGVDWALLTIGEIVSRPEYQFTDVLGREVLLVSALLLPMTIAFGAAFPFAVALASGRDDTVTEHLGRIYAINTLGAILGSLLAGFVLIPTIGLHMGQM